METNGKHEAALPGYAALAPGDKADAKRRRPDVALHDYAVRRDLTFLGSGVAPDCAAALPDDERLRFNVMSDGAGACLFHWVRPWPVMDGRPGYGTFYGVRYRTPRSSRPWWKSLLDLSWLPWVGWLFDLFGSPAEVSSQPDAVGVPCTVAATPVPEAAALPWMTIDNFAKPRHVGCHREKLEGRGLRGWTLLAGDPPPADVVERLLTPAVRTALGRGAAQPFFELRIRGGVVAVCRNGFLADETELDALRAAAATAGAALADALRTPVLRAGA